MLGRNRWRAVMSWARSEKSRVTAPSRRRSTHLRDERGVTIVEYALLLALIAVLSVGSLVLLGNSVSKQVATLSDQIVSGGNAYDTITATSGTPQSTAVNTQFPGQFAVQVLDQNNKPVPGIVITFSAPAAGASGTFGSATGPFSVTSQPTDSNGDASAPSFLFANGTGGTFNVTGSAVGIIGKATFALKNDSAASDAYTLTACPAPQAGQSAVVAKPFTSGLTANVKDSAGPVANVTIVFTAPTTGASAVFSNNTNSVQATTDSAGNSPAQPFSAGHTVGTYQVAVNAYIGAVNPADQVGTTVDCSETNTVGASLISIVAGYGQSATVNTAFATPLEVLIADQYGNPVSGLAVNFTAVAAAGATGTFPGNASTAQVNTSPSGYATAPALTANGTAGPYTVTATAAGATPSGTPALPFAETNLANNVGGLVMTVVSGNNQSRDCEHRFSHAIGSFGRQPVRSQPGLWPPCHLYREPRLRGSRCDVPRQRG